MKKYIIEFIGTFFLILTIALTGNPIAIGVVLIALVYMGGYISGAHYNPAVSLTIWLSKKMKAVEAVKYMLVQILGGIFAAGAYQLIHGNHFVPKPAPHVTWYSALTIEILFTFLLTSVILHVAATEKTKGNDYYGLAIGFTLMAAAFVGGPVSGGVFNPAVALGPMLYDFTTISTNFSNLILYLAGPFLGGIIAAIVYKIK